MENLETADKKLSLLLEPKLKVALEDYVYKQDAQVCRLILLLICLLFMFVPLGVDLQKLTRFPTVPWQGIVYRTSWRPSYASVVFVCLPPTQRVAWRINRRAHAGSSLAPPPQAFFFSASSVFFFARTSGDERATWWKSPSKARVSSPFNSLPPPIHDVVCACLLACLPVAPPSPLTPPRR